MKKTESYDALFLLSLLALGAPSLFKPIIMGPKNILHLPWSLEDSMTKGHKLGTCLMSSLTRGTIIEGI
jgi:hypothetical protein